MNNIDKYKYWVMLADYDIDTVNVLIEGERWVYVAYVCQQAVERQLKGMYVYYLDKEAPKTHNINFLFKKIADDMEFANNEAFDSYEEGTNDCEDFLSEIMFYYMSDYPFSYKNIKNRFIDNQCAVDLYSRTIKWVNWLRSFQPDIGNTSYLVENLTIENMNQ